MKKSIIIFLFILGTKALFGQTPSFEYNKFIRKGDSLYKAKNENAPYAYSAAFKTMHWRVVPAGYYMNDCYNAARAWTMVNEPDSAFFYLDRIIKKLSFMDFDKISNDSAFISLHYDNRWKPLIETIIPKSSFEMPDSWFKAGSKPMSYQMGIDKGSGQDGKNAATIKSINKEINGFGTLMQDCKPNKYLGKRIRMTGYIKSKDVVSWAGLWLRVDGTDPKKSLSFDNMHDRSVKGTTDWNKYEIVLDVPNDATNIAFGALLDSTGQIWFDSFKFEIVDNAVPTTGNPNKVDKNNEPTNLDFEK